MFRKPLDKKRLMELAGISLPDHGAPTPPRGEVDSDAGLHGEQPAGGTEEPTEEHLDKESSVFDKVDQALEGLLSFLQGEEGFEEKRGKEDEYRQMEQDATALKELMKKHLSGYDPEAEPETEDDHGDVDKPDVMRMVK